MRKGVAGGGGGQKQLAELIRRSRREGAAEDRIWGGGGGGGRRRDNANSNSENLLPSLPIPFTSQLCHRILSQTPCLLLTLNRATL